VQIQKHEYQHGVALSKDEEKLLLTRLIEPDFKIAAAIALYTGLRPNELETAKINGAFIIAINSKRKNKKVEYKRIPIIDALRPYLKNGIPVLPTPQLLRRRVSAALPNHKLYDLRTTFYTRCDEYGVSQPARDEFVGHSGGALTNAYRDLSNEYLLKEARKLNEWK
jgi:integrase